MIFSCNMKIRNYLEISVGMTNKGGDEVDLAKITELRRVKLDREKNSVHQNKNDSTIFIIPMHARGDLLF
jgi:hypothetical protein